MTHTPGPWHVEIYNDGKNMDIQDKDGVGVLTKNNAAFIVRACNSHEAMLEALKDLLDYAVDPAQFTRQNVIAFIDKGTEALRLAEGGKP